MESGNKISLLNKTTFALTIIVGAGYYYGLDKLFSLAIILLLFSILKAFEHFINHAETEDLRIPGFSNLKDNPQKLLKVRRWVKILANFVSVAVCALVINGLFQVFAGLNLSVYDPFNRILLSFAISLGIVFYSIFAIRTLEGKTGKESDIDLKWYRVIAYFAIYHAIIFLPQIISALVNIGLHPTLEMTIDFGFFLGFIAMALLTAEILIGFLRNLYFLFKSNRMEFPPALPFFIGCLAAEKTFKASMVKTLETISGVNLANSEIVNFGMRIFEPVCIISVLTIWLMSSIVIVGPDQQAIFTRFGNIVEDQAFPSGFYFKLPWPFSAADYYDSYKIKTLNIGFEPDPDQEHIIWTKPHTLKYFDLVVGDGVEIIAIDCQVMFVINDLYKYTTRMYNPDEFISAKTYNLLTQETVSETFDNIVSRDRQILSNQIKSRLQQTIDDLDIGVRIVEVVFIAMHPPLEVANSFEDVISAQIDKHTYVLEAKTENTLRTSMNIALAKGREYDAQSYAAKTTAEAFGYSSSFADRHIGYEIDPDLTSYRLRLDMLKQVLSGKKLYILDKSLLRSDDRLYLNLR